MPTPPVSALDAATGTVNTLYEETARADEILFSDGRLIVSINPPKSARPAVVEKDDVLHRPGQAGLRARRGDGPHAVESRPFLRVSAPAAARTRSADSNWCRRRQSSCSRGPSSVWPSIRARLWRIDRPALPPDAVRKLGFSGMYEYLLTVMVYHDGVLLLAQPEPNTHHTYHTMPGTLYAFDARDGARCGSTPTAAGGTARRPTCSWAAQVGHT